MILPHLLDVIPGKADRHKMNGAVKFTSSVSCQSVVETLPPSSRQLFTAALFIRMSQVVKTEIATHWSSFLRSQEIAWAPVSVSKLQAVSFPRKY
jgi:hypothetical protein